MFPKLPKYWPCIKWTGVLLFKGGWQGIFKKKHFFLRDHWANFNQTWHIGYFGERNIKFVVIKWNCENTLTTINVFPSITRGVFFATWKRIERSFIPFLWSWKILRRHFHSFPEEASLVGRVTWFKIADRYCTPLCGKCGFEADSTNLDIFMRHKCNNGKIYVLKIHPYF